MERSSLEALDRDTLIQRAEDAGVARARILTRPELVDELLLRDARSGSGDGRDGRRHDEVQRARGFFGRARDLLARIVERGLNLPDAAERIRAASTPPPARTMPPALPTVTLAEMYATQGHTARAVETLQRVLEQEPEHAAARALLNQLEEPSYRSPTARPLPPEEPHELEKLEKLETATKSAVGSSELTGKSAKTNGISGANGTAGALADHAELAAEPPAEPLGMLDDALLPPHYDVDECVALPVDPTTLFVYWEVRERSWEHLQAQRAGGGVVLRVLVIQPAWDGPRTETRDYPVGARMGDWFVRDLPAGCVVRAAIGWKENVAFLPVAHSPALETPPGFPSPVLAESFVRWTPRGSFRVPADDVMGTQVARAVDAFRQRIDGQPGAWAAVAGAAPGGHDAGFGGAPFGGAAGGAGAGTGDGAGGAGAAGGGATGGGTYRASIEWYPVGASEKAARRHGEYAPADERNASSGERRPPLGSSDQHVGSSERAAPRPNSSAAFG